MRRLDKPAEANMRNAVAHEWMMPRAEFATCYESRGTLNTAASGPLTASSTVQG